jgi:hypothetical protein
MEAVRSPGGTDQAIGRAAAWLTSNINQADPSHAGRLLRITGLSNLLYR